MKTALYVILSAWFFAAAFRYRIMRFVLSGVSMFFGVAVFISYAVAIADSRLLWILRGALTMITGYILIAIVYHEIKARYYAV